jgi:hypothetical protein
MLKLYYEMYSSNAPAIEMNGQQFDSTYVLFYESLPYYDYFVLVSSQCFFIDFVFSLNYTVTHVQGYLNA